MKHEPKVIGLLQAIGLILYVIIFAVSANQVREWSPVYGTAINPVASIITFLLAFVISALICGSLIFLYPALLFFEGKREAGLRIIFWSTLWLILFFAIFAVVGLFIL